MISNATCMISVISVLLFWYMYFSHLKGLRGGAARVVKRPADGQSCCPGLSDEKEDTSRVFVKIDEPLDLEYLEKLKNRPIPEMTYAEMMDAIRDEGLDRDSGAFLMCGDSPMRFFGNYGDVRLNKDKDGSYVVLVMGDRGPLSADKFDKPEQAYYKTVSQLRARKIMYHSEEVYSKAEKSPVSAPPEENASKAEKSPASSAADKKASKAGAARKKEKISFTAKEPSPEKAVPVRDPSDGKVRTKFVLRAALIGYLILMLIAVAVFLAVNLGWL